MNRNELYAAWKAEEDVAHIHGWDFSYLSGRCIEKKDFPWDYREIIQSYLTPEMRILDMETGGGEFLLSLGHPHKNTAATEGYPPNVEVCKEALLPLGIDFRPAESGGALPFDDESFDMVINRHGDFDPQEIYRVLKPGGLFITQQVGAVNDRELVDLVMPEKQPLPFPGQYLDLTAERFRNAGFEIVDGQEHFGCMRFLDVGAVVWFARVIEWEFIDFSVDRCFEQLLNAQKLLEENGCLTCRTHRFLLVAKKA